MGGTSLLPGVPGYAGSVDEPQLGNPAQAALKRHLHLVNEEDDDPSPDDEPFVSPSAAARRIKRQVLHTFVVEAALGSLPQALCAWPEHFRQLYEEEGLRCRVPEHGFGAADQAFLRSELTELVSFDGAQADSVDTVLVPEHFIHRVIPDHGHLPALDFAEQSFLQDLLGTQPVPRSHDSR